jgi:hypothetical protein
MAHAYQIRLEEAERQTLQECRDHHPLPYMRMRAAAILKVSDGLAVRQVAAHGLLKPVTQEAVSSWLHRYQAQGIAGLRVKPGRGRKPAFSPCEPTAGCRLPPRPALSQSALL